MKFNVLVRDEDGGHYWKQVTAKGETDAKMKVAAALPEGHFPVAVTRVEEKK